MFAPVRRGLAGTNTGELLGVLHAELRDAAASTHDSVRRLVVHCGGEVVSIEGTILRARPGLARFDGELLMRHLLVDPAVIPESVGWS